MKKYPSMWRSVLERLLAEITSAISEHRGQQIRNGLKVALIGLPNAGKSSLLNALAGRNAAIVDAEAGTTRDIIEVDLILRGYKVILADTAGVRETENSVEQEGVRRAISWADAADLRLLIKDGAADAPMESSLLGLGRKGDWIIISKCDEQTSRADQDVVHDPVDDRFVVMEASIYRPQTLLALRDRLSTWAVDALSGADFPAVTRERHRRLLIEVQAHLERGLKRQDLSVELVAEDVRLAARSIERLSGRIGSEDILDHVFGSFCIGK